jgi:hypothetical protein
MKGQKTGGRCLGSRNKINRATADLRAVAGQYTAEAIDTLVAIMRAESAPLAARVMAARELLDRGHGKPAQAITGPDGSSPGCPLSCGTSTTTRRPSHTRPSYGPSSVDARDAGEAFCAD